MTVARLWDRPIPGATHRRHLRRAAIVRAARRPAASRIGETSGRLTVVAIAEPTSDGRTRLACRCSCGATDVVVGLADFVSHRTLSCGCLRAEVAADNGRSAVARRGAR